MNSVPNNNSTAVEEKSKLLEKLAAQLEEQVRCPVCLEVPTSGSIYSCPKGHLQCATCYKGPTSNCPLCRTKMFSTVSLLATTVVENLEHQCKFEAEGCKVRVELCKVEEHRRICNFRPVRCPSYLCEKNVPYEHLVDHVLNECEHSFSKLDEGMCINVEKSSTLSFMETISRTSWNR